MDILPLVSRREAQGSRGRGRGGFLKAGLELGKEGEACYFSPLRTHSQQGRLYSTELRGGGEKVVEKRKDESTPLQHDYLPYVLSRKKKGRRKKTLQHHPQYLHHPSQPAAKLDIRAGTTVPKASALRLIAAFCAKQTHLRN